MERIGKIISRDIGMTAKILQLVNSAFFGLAQPISNPQDAVIYLGLNTIRSLALSVGIFSQYDEKLCRLFSLDVLARHSWTTGVLARSVAHMERRELKVLEQCFLAGLLHDVGQLVLAAGLHEEYTGVIAKAKAAKSPGLAGGAGTFWRLARGRGGGGAYLLALWGLPNPIIEAVAMHHEPARCAAPEFFAGDRRPCRRFFCP